MPDMHANTNFSTMSYGMDVYNGLYVGNYTLTKAGNYSWFMLVDGLPIDGSPWDLRVLPQVVDPHMCTAEGFGVVGGYTGVLTPLKIISRDRYGNKRSADPNAKWTIEIEVSGRTGMERVKKRKVERDIVIGCSTGLTVTTKYGTPLCTCGGETEEFSVATVLKYGVSLPAFYLVVIANAATGTEIAASPYEPRFLHNNNTSPATVNFSSVYGPGPSNPLPLLCTQSTT